ncbi:MULTISPECIES: collagen-like protein [unclassified Methylobacterium]|jgi:Collagen triple helix repeat (20 copies)|uniref:collagen-like protein n=1 Tax=unclassified Methylobacterium TaxID=2615210 RepID=UPI001353EBFB|nr:collagen-like protein [Methylobacterium sp. 2A]MWV22456.1 collagen-like protein [Methylobacterium sp. 2A]
MPTAYLIEAIAKPGKVQTVNPSRQQLMRAAIAAATGYRFWTTQTACKEQSDLPADRQPFPGFDDVSVTSSGTVTVASAATAISLVGPPGKDGQPGANGKDGAPGKDGSSGTNGKDGGQGIQGVPGPSTLHFAGFTTTDSKGAFSLTWSKPFATGVVPIVKVDPAVTDGYVYRITKLDTATGTTGAVLRALLSTGVLGAFTAAPAGVTLSILAFEPYP